MKVLLITDNHSPQIGGAEKYFFTLKEELKQHNIHVVSLGFGPNKQIGQDFFIFKETPSKAIRQFWRMFLHPIKYWQLRRCIKKINPDVIHLHNVKKYTIALLKAVKGYPVVQTVHDYSAICPTLWNIHPDMQPCVSGFRLKCLFQHQRDYNFISYLALIVSFVRMKKLLKKIVTRFIAPSPSLHDYLHQQDFKNVSYLPPFKNTIVKSHFETIRPNHFLFIGQLEKQKGIYILLQEFALACRQQNNLILKIAGRGTEENFLKAKVRELKLENNIHFLGWTNAPRQLYQECTAVIFPSIGLESFGLVITEAMSYGRAVIGSRRGPTSWLIEHNKTGLLFDPLISGDLANCILTLANNIELAQSFGKTAADELDRFPSNQEILSKIIDTYHEVCRL